MSYKGSIENTFSNAWKIERVGPTFAVHLKSAG